MPSHHDCRISSRNIRPVEVVRPRNGERTICIHARIKADCDRLLQRLRRGWGRQTLFEKLHLAQPRKLRVAAVVRVDDKFHLPHASRREIKVLAGLRNRASRLAKIERRHRGESSARSRRSLHQHLIRASRGEPACFVVVPNLEAREVHDRAEVERNLRWQRIVRRSEYAIGKPHRAVRCRSVLSVREPRSIHSAGRKPRVRRTEFR